MLAQYCLGSSFLVAFGFHLFQVYNADSHHKMPGIEKIHKMDQPEAEGMQTEENENVNIQNKLVSIVSSTN